MTKEDKILKNQKTIIKNQERLADMLMELSDKTFLQLGSHNKTVKAYNKINGWYEQ